MDNVQNNKLPINLHTYNQVGGCLTENLVNPKKVNRCMNQLMKIIKMQWEIITGIDQGWQLINYR